MAARLGMMSLLLLTVLLVATGVTPAIAVAGWRPDVVALAVIAFAMADGPSTGARFGFAAGLGVDLLAGPAQIVGLSALVLLTVGYVVGVLRAYVTGTALAAQVLLGAAGTALAVAGYGLLAMLLDTAPARFLGPLEAAAWTALYSAVVAPFVIGPITALARRWPQRAPATRLG